MKTHSLRICLPTLVLLAVVGVPACSNTGVNSVERENPMTLRQGIEDKRVITNGALNRRVQVVRVNEGTGAGGFLKVQVEVQNTTSARQAFSYRVDWFDENHILISLPTTTAIPRSLEPKETAFLTATAPTEKAKDFRFEFLAPASDQ